MHDKLMGVAGSLLATCMYLFYKMLLLVVKKKSREVETVGIFLMLKK